MSYSFGDANNLKKLDFGKLKANLTKEELGIEENTFAASIFNSIDTDGNKKLSKKELNIFAKAIKELAGDDNHLSNEEAGGYSVDEQNIADMENTYTDNRINSAGERLHSKVVEFFRFINSLVEQTEGVESVKNKRKKSIIKYENGTTEIRYDDGNIIVKDANGKVIIDTKKSIEPEKGSPVTDEQYYMINYLKEQLTNAKAVMEQIENFSKDSSFAAGLTNWWYDITGKEFSRENLENLISNLEENVGLLEKAANKSPEEFARVCQEKLGINFDAQKVEDFMIQAQEFSLLQQQMSVLAKTRSPRSYIGNHGHAAADAMASYREMSEMFINICQQMGYKEDDIVGIVQEALAEYNKDDSNYNLTSISFDSLQNPDNLYVMATREGGGSDVAPSEFYDLLFKKLSSRIESDMITLYDIGGEGTSADKVNKFYESKKESYNGNLSAVLGASNVEDMANTYGEELQSGITNVNGFFTTVTMVATFASGGVGFLANVAKGTNLVSKSARALSLCDKAIRFTNGANRFISVAGMVAAANPTTFFDQLFSENGMTADAFCAWGKGVLQNAAFMGSGMLASRQAMKLANCYKSKALVNLFKKGEQSFDDLMNAIKSRPQNFPPDLVKSLNSVSRASTMLQVSAETILDTIYTVSLGISMQGDDYEFTGEDFLMSLAFAINGGVLQKELAPISDQAKARYIQDALKDFELSNDDALKIVDYLKKIDEGELTFTNGKLKQERVLDEVEIIAKAEDNVAGINHGERTSVAPTAVKPSTSFENFCSSIRNSDAKAEIFKAEDGRIVARVRTTSQMAKAKYDCYVFNKDGEIISYTENIKKSDFESNYADFKESGTVRNTSGTLNSGFNFFSLFSKPEVNLDFLKGRLSQDSKAQLKIPGKTWNDVKPIVENLCEKYNMDYNVVIEHYLKGLSTELTIFRNEETLKDYILTIYDLSNNKTATSPYQTTVYNYKEGRLQKIIDSNFIREIALLESSSDKNKATIARLKILSENGNITRYDFKKIIKYMKEGYFSSSTIDLYLSDSSFKKITDLYDRNYTKTDRKNRKDIIKNITRFYPELKDNFKDLLKEIGKDEFYGIKWETLLNKNMTESDYKNVIKDVKNIIKLKNREIENVNFFINIPGYKKNYNWANEMVNIAEITSHMINEGKSFDEVMSYLSATVREYTLSIASKIDDSHKVYGVVRGYKEGYLSYDGLQKHGAITPSDCEPYNFYLERFRMRYNDQLQNPYEGRIELTRLVPDGEYPIYDENGKLIRYTKREAMIHPKGELGIEGLNIARELHDKLLSQYADKKITAKDLDNINETIGEIHWVIAHTMPWGRGSDAIANAYVKSLYESLGIKTYPPKEGISFDLEAFCTNLDDYKKNYKNLYSQNPEIK